MTLPPSATIAPADDPFDPFRLQPLASLNRRRLLIPPGLDDAVAGKTAGEVLSRAALSQTVAHAAQQLGLPAPAQAHAPRLLTTWLAAPDARVRAVALAIAELYGRRLGWLFASMHPATSVSLDPDAWEQAYLVHWEQHLHAIILGGGLAHGRLGTVIAHAAQAALRALGTPRLTVAAAPEAVWLPLIGAARCVPGTVRSRGVVVADFGGTQAKAGIAQFDADGTLQTLQLRPAYDLADLSDGTQPAALAAALGEVLRAAYRDAVQHMPIHPHVMCSLAAYLDAQGQPVRGGRGAYSQLATLAEPLPVSAWLARQLSATLATPIEVRLVRDAEAAGVAYAGQRPPRSTAVVMAGTALGVGFVPEGTSYRPVARRFRVVEPA